MKVTITTQSPISVKITTQNPEILEVLPAIGITVSVSVIKDGRDGKSAYQSWLDDGNVGTESEFLESLKGADGNPGQDAVNNTLEMVRAENPTIDGNINANGNTIENLRNPVASQEPATKAIVDAALQAAKDYADTVSAETVRFAGFWDASLGTYPTGGTIRRGDQYEISVPGTIAGNDYEVGDLLRARINSPGQTTANWSASQGNVQQATETIQGTAKVISSAEAANENSTNDKDFVTGKKLWLNFVIRFLSLPWTWSGKQIFTVAPRFSSTAAGQYLKVDSAKEVVSVSAIPANDITESVEKRFTNDADFDKIDLFQTSSAYNIWRAGSTSVAAIGNNLGPSFSAQVTRTLSNSSDYQKKQRFGNVTASTAGSLASYRLTTLHFVLDGLEYFEQTIGTAEGSATSGMRAVFGIFPNIGALSSNIEYNTLTDLIGLCRLSSSNNWHIIHNDNSGLATTIDLGSDFPANIPEELITFRIKPKASNNVDVTVFRRNTGDVITHNITTNLPQTSSLFTLKGGSNNNNNAVAFGWDFFAITEKFL